MRVRTVLGVFLALVVSVGLVGCGWSGVSPSVTAQPANQTVISGQAASFSAAFAGTSPQLQWYRNGIPIAGATGPTYTLPSTTLADSGSTFSVTASNPGGVAKSAVATLTVQPIPPDLSVASPGPKVYGAAPFPVSASSDSSAPITWVVKSGPAQISGNTVDVTAAGTVVLAASQPAEGQYAAAQVTTSFNVAPATPTLTFSAVMAKTFGDGPFQVSAGSVSNGPVTYAVTGGPATVSGNTVTLTGAGTVVLAATQAATTDYTAATASTSFTVAQASPKLTFAGIASKTFGDSPFAVSATSASTGAVTYSVVSGPATVAGSTVTLTGAGTVTLSASQAADANYTTATASATFSVAQGTPNLAFAPIGVKTFGDAPFAISASSGSTGAVSYSLVSGPATLSGSTVTITGTGTVTLSASQQADSNYVAGTATTTFTINPAPPTVVSLSNTSLNFGNFVVGQPAAKQAVTVANVGTNTLYLSPTLTGDESFGLAADSTCGTVLAAGASCVLNLTYAPTASSSGTPQTASLNLQFENSTSPETVSLSGVAGVLNGTVAGTAHAQVAAYTVNVPFPGSVTVHFGPTTAYGLQTWTKDVSAPGPVTILVAGMLANSSYHLQASVQFADGTSAKDTDHTFNTGITAFPLTLAVDTPSGLTPQPGVEQLSAFNGTFWGLYVLDLQGRTLWNYIDPGGLNIEGAKLLKNGNFVMTLGQGSGYSLTGTSDANSVAVREVDFALNTVRQITTGELTTKLQAAGYNIKLEQFHHEVTELPNGNWLVLSNSMRTFSNLTGIPGDTTVLGDVVIELDANLNPVWVWDEFDHLDVNRHPWNFPDWTHTNAVVYSPDDGNLLISMRHQNWVIKVDFRDGQGTGNVLWHLGADGDFTLINGTDPTDWPWAQHYPSFFSPNTSGVFKLGLMNNGDDREFPTGVQCDTTGQPPCLYTSIPIFQLDENAMTATLVWNQNLPTSLYSFFGGNTEQMLNGNVEYDLAGTNTTMADIFEVTQDPTPQTVWHMHSTGNVYRGFRIPSLYPGVQW